MADAFTSVDQHHWDNGNVPTRGTGDREDVSPIIGLVLQSMWVMLQNEISLHMKTTAADSRHYYGVDENILGMQLFVMYSLSV